MLYEGLIEKPENNGAVSLYNTASDDELLMIAESMCSEESKPARAGGHEIRRWSRRRKQPYDNDFWDSSSAAIAMAIACGVQDSEIAARPEPERQKKSRVRKSRPRYDDACRANDKYTAILAA